MDEGFPSPARNMLPLAPRPPPLGFSEERAKSSPGMTRTKMSDPTGLGGRSPGMSPRLLRSAGSSRSRFTGRPFTANGAGSQKRTMTPRKDDIVSQAIEFAQSKASSFQMGDETSLLSRRLEPANSKTQEKLQYQQRLIAHLKQQVATLHIHGQRLLYQNKELKRKVDVLQTKLEEESIIRVASSRSTITEELSAERVSATPEMEDRAIQVPAGSFESLTTAKARLVAFLSSAVWTWKFSEVSQAICTAAGVQSVVLIARNPASGALVSSEDRSVTGIGSLFRTLAADQPESIAKATAEAGTALVIPNPYSDARYNIALDILSSKVEPCCVTSVPIVYQSKVIGVMQTLARHRTSMAARELEVLQSLAKACVEPLRVRLENEQRLVDMAMQLKSFAAQLGALTTRNRSLPFIARMIELQVKQVCACDEVHVVWLDPASSSICRVDPSAAGGDGGDDGEEVESVLRVPAGGVTGECLSKGAELLASRAKQHPLFAAASDGVSADWNGSLLLLPMRTGAPENDAGMALRLVANTTQGLEGQEQHLLAALQALLAVVLNAMPEVFAAAALHGKAGSAHRAGERRAEEEEEGLTGLQRFCLRVARQVAGAVNHRASRVGFYAVDPFQCHVQTVPVPHLRPDAAAQLPPVKPVEGAFGQGLCGTVAASGKGLMVPCPNQDARYDARMDGLSAAEGSQPSLWLPMVDAAGLVRGVVSVLLEAPQKMMQGDMPFAQEEVAAITRICAHHAPFFAEIACSSAVEQERRLWRTVAEEVRRPFEELDLGSACERVKSMLAELLRLGRCQLYLFDSEKQVLRQCSGQGPGKEMEVELNGTHLLSVASRSGEVLVLPRARDDRSGLTRSDLPCMPGSAQQALLVVPIVDSGGIPIMAIQAERGHLNFSALEQEVVRVIQASAALALEHARFGDAMERARAPDDSLAECLTIEAAMRRIITTACRIAKCEQAMIFWPSPEGSMCLYYLEERQVKMKHLYTTQGIAATCLVADKALMLTDARTHQKFHPVMDGTELSIFSSRSGESGANINSIYHPIHDKATHQPKAVLCVRDKKKGLKFNRSDVMALGVFAKRVAVTLRNVEKHEGVLEVARSGEMRSAQMAHLNSIRTMQVEAMRKLSTRVKINTVVAKMTQTMASLLNVAVCKLHIIEERGKLVRALGNTSMQDKVTELAKAPLSDIVARAAKANETILFDLSTLPEDEVPLGVAFEVDGVEMHNSLTVPLRAETGQPFAVLQFINKYEGGFDGSDELVVHMAGAAFETVLDTDALDRVRFEIGLGSVKASLSEIAGAILDKAVQLVPADTGQVLMLVEGHQKLRRHAEVAVTGERVRKISFLEDMQRSEHADPASSTYNATQGLAGAVVQTRHTINVPNIRKDPRFDSTIDLKSDSSGHSSLLTCPLVTATGQAMGVVQLAKSGMSQFSAKDVQLLHVLSTQGGTIISNREQHEQSVSETASSILHVTSSILRCLEVQPSVDVIVNRIADRAINVVPCENAALLFKGREEAWTFIATTDEDVRRVAGKKANRTVFALERAHKEIRIPLSNGIVAEALNTRNAVEIPNAMADTRVNWSFEALCVSELRNMLVIPIFRDRQCGGVGLLVLVNKKDHPSFLHDDARRLDSYKDAISAAVNTIGRCRSWKLQDLLDVMRDP